MRKYALIFSLIVIAMTAHAIPAWHGPVIKTQPDGSQIVIWQHGDEYFHYFTDSEGNWLKINDNGMFERCEKMSEEQIQQQRLQSPRLQNSRRRIGVLNIAPRGLIILVNFVDLSFNPKNTREEFDEMHNSDNYTYGGATGSARRYFQDQSMGAYNPVFDVVGPVTVSQPYKYYGQNDRYGNDMHPDEMVAEACQLAKEADPEINFTEYDNDHDGYVDFVYIVYAGYNEAQGGSVNTIWPHNYYITATGTNCKIDGVRIDNYACSSELQGYTGTVRSGIGTFCHEFSHVLGLPDLYITNNKGIHKTLGEWDILDSGNYNNNSRTPPSYSAYERFFMGWLTPDLLTERGDFELEDIQTSNKCFLLTEKGVHNLNGVYPSPVDFYLLENRQRNSWDKYLPGSGMMITHIRFSKSRWNSNIVNNAEESMGVDIVEADGKTPTADDYINGNGGGYLGKQGDLFPYDTIDKFVPYRESPINHIRHKDGKITFKFKGGTRNINQFVLDEDGTEEVEGIYTFDGHKMGITDLNLLPAGIYIIYKTKNGERVKSSKIVIAP